MTAETENARVEAIALLIDAGSALANLAGMTDLAGCQPDPAMRKKIADWDRLLPNAIASHAALQTLLDETQAAQLRNTEAMSEQLLTIGSLRQENAALQAECAEQDIVVNDLRDALAFYDHVKASSLDEKIAVGQDHYDWVFSAACKVVARQALAAQTVELRPMSSAPKDGSPFNVRVIHTHRWLPYKANSQQYKNGQRGRWQRATEYGWENCKQPDADGWQPLKQAQPVEVSDG